MANTVYWIHTHSAQEKLVLVAKHLLLWEPFVVRFCASPTLTTSSFAAIYLKNYRSSTSENMISFPLARFSPGMLVEWLEWSTSNHCHCNHRWLDVLLLASGGPFKANVEIIKAEKLCRFSAPSIRTFSTRPRLVSDVYRSPVWKAMARHTGKHHQHKLIQQN